MGGIQTGLTDAQLLASQLKAHDLVGLTASASEINYSIDNKIQFILGNNGYDYSSRKEMTDISRWTTHIPGTDYIFEESTSFLKYATKSIKFGNTISGDTSLSSRSISLTNSIDLTNIETLSFWFYVEDSLVENLKYSSQWGAMLFSIGDLNFTTFQQGLNLFGASGGSFTKGWNNITVHKDSFVINLKGVVDFSNIQSFQMRWDKLVDSTNTPLYLDSIFIGGEIRNHKTPVCITLDDSNREQYEMVNIMNSYGVPCSLNVMPDYIDNPSLYTNSMSLNELDMLYKKGNHIGIHHQSVAAFSLNHQLVLDTSLWIKNNGFIRDDGYFYGSYPNGAYNQSLIDFLILNGFKGMRTDAGRDRNDLQNAEATAGIVTRNSILNGGLSNSLKVCGKNASTSSNAISYIEDAIKHKSAFVQIIHSFSEIGGRSEWILLAKYLKTKIDDGTIECLTFPQFCKKYSN